MGRIQQHELEEISQQQPQGPSSSAMPVIDNLQEQQLPQRPQSSTIPVIANYHQQQLPQGPQSSAIPIIASHQQQQLPQGPQSSAAISGNNSSVGMVQNSFIGCPWSTGLFDCHENQTNAIMTAFLPCVTFVQVAEILDGGKLSCPLGTLIYMLMMPGICSQWIMGSKYRTKLRKKYDLVEAPYEDAISHAFCPCCSLCQEFRELKNRGLDPALGWKGILSQVEGRSYQDGHVQIPPQPQSMSM